ncbi:MAG TPA: serine protease [Actinotalea sp.]|nr:serine protease [Actinotalea sp.]
MSRTRGRAPGGRAGLRAPWLVVAIALAAATGCAGVDVPQMPGPAITDWVPPSGADPGDGSSTLSPDGFASAERMAVRIRNVGCDSLSTGSGFALDARTLVTNRHVVVDSSELQVETYDGRDIAVTAAASAALADLAVIRTAEDLPDHPELAGSDPELGDSVSVIGYPLGGLLTVTTGRVIGRTTDPLNENLGEVLVTDAEVAPGSSGSAVVDSEGRVVGVVYAKNAADQSFIVPVSTVRNLLADDSAFAPVDACG